MSQPKYSTRCVDRFLEYVKFDTQSEEESEEYPSTAKQLVLLKHLVDELKSLGLDDVSMDEYGYVFATLPATTTKDVPVIGFIAHVDTSPEMPGDGIKAIIHKNYQGQDIVLPDDETAVLRYDDNPALAEQKGNDIITASGTTLLGADNKAGVAEIVSAAEYLIAHPEIEHGKIRLGFTPDEEVGSGTKFFDVEKFGATYAYTMDGETLGQLEVETFSADSLTATFKGFNTHPGFAKGKMTNAIKVAADFITRLPKEGLSPETTEGYEGFVHPYVIQAGVESTAVKFLIRDFKTELLKEKEDLLKKLAEETVADWPGSSVNVVVVEQYRNMGEILEAHPKVIAAAKKAIVNSGLELRMSPIRGGTDGSRLSFMGLPTPNIFAGEHNFHSRLEWISTSDMHKAVEVIVELCKVWAE
ncbi:MAG: peptidase T [Acidobacteria bacterium]|uniref:Peptidase T n=1 Tax=Candidatus Polarisedimenticola svalbardensis TaxID=2886004 RepID=A0A8J7CDK3_9BACT|nr:peptidase T [Candidatus Polarisedimenticola svalbardensis]